MGEFGNAKCHYAKFGNANLCVFMLSATESCYADCRFALWHYADCCKAECSYDDSHYAQFHYGECHMA